MSASCHGPLLRTQRFAKGLREKCPLALVPAFLIGPVVEKHELMVAFTILVSPAMLS